MPRYFVWLLAALVTCGAAVWAPTASAQPKLDNILTGKPLSGQPAGPGATPESVIAVSAQATAGAAGRPAQISVTAKVQPGWHIYSLSQKRVKAEPTTITLDDSSEFRLLGNFRPNLPPHVVKRDGDTFEEYEGEVTWQAPVEIKQGVDPSKLKISGRARIQTCRENACLQPHVFTFAANVTPAGAQITSTGTFSDPNQHATLTGRIEPATVAPGGQARLIVEATPADHWHVYQLAARDSGSLGYKPTLIVLTNTSGLQYANTTASSKPIEAPPVLAGEPPQHYHVDRVAWSTPIAVPKNAKPGQYTIAGLIGYQTCTDTGCDLPRGARFEGTLTVGTGGAAGGAPLSFSEGKYGEAAKLAATQTNRRSEVDTDNVVESDDTSLAGLPLILLSAFAGGFLLNFMPCVLPVIGLKILSFAEQSGRHRAQILALNIWYSLGLMSVFMVLAVLATGASLGLSDENLGWGQQFTSTTFNIVMVAIVFSMALSFLGVWEIPIPGFASSSKANDLASREGALGAFTKGIMATVLSTPCSGPFLGPVFGFTLSQPPYVTFLIFAAMGLGMAAPYLAIGAFPRLIRFLPKPGAWMETFKHMMGFVLLGTIVFLFTFMNKDYIVPTFALMVGIWAACWWIGRISLVEPLPVRLKAWAQGAAVAAVVGFASFHYLTPHESLIAWKSFSRAEVERLTSEGHTVLVDFTADWCLTCKLNLARAIETDDVKQLLEENKVVPLLADWTEPSDEIKAALESINRNSIPQLVVYPPGPGSKPIVLSDLLTQSQVLDAIRQAGPSKVESQSLVSSTR